MRLAAICFTRAGEDLLIRLLRGLRESGHQACGYGKWKGHRENGELLTVRESLGEWTGRQFHSQDGIIFIGAVGIAVRAISPFLKCKQADPAVVVFDDMGRFCVSLLSGHAGGANALAEEAARVVGAVPVITTATDIHGKFAPDRFAAERGLWVSDWEKAKQISAGLLAGERAGLFCDFPVSGEPEEGLIRNQWQDMNIWVTVRQRARDTPFFPYESQGMEKYEREQKKLLRLVPRITALGIGCRKNTQKDTIRQAVRLVFEEENMELESVEAVASLDLKKEEPGLVEFAREIGAEWKTYSAKELLEVPGEFSSSDFVRQVAGVDNVCERAALLWVRQHGGGYLRIRKRAVSGVTVAAAVRDWRMEL